MGAAGVLVLTGEAGTGKTLLLEQAAAQSDSALILRACGTPPEQDVPFAALLTLLRPVLGLRDRLPAAQSRALESALGLRDHPEAAGRFAVGAATLELLCCAAEERPVLVLVDDAHWLDRPSAEAITFAARRLYADTVAMLIACRSDTEFHTAALDLPALELPPLTEDDTSALAATRWGRPIPSELAATVHRLTGGNPLAVVELTRDPEALERLSPVTEIPVPDALLHGFTRDFAKLSPQARIALRVAALGSADPLPVAAACTALDTEIGWLEEAESAGLLRLSPGRIEFRHPLIRAAVRADADAAQLRATHRALAATCGHPDRRAWHLAEAAIGPDPEVADLVAAAGERATHRGADLVAAAAFERSAQLTVDAATRTQRMLIAAESAWRAGYLTRAQTLLEAVTLAEMPAPRRFAVPILAAGIALDEGRPALARDIVVEAYNRSQPLLSGPARIPAMTTAVATCEPEQTTALDPALEVDGEIDSAIALLSSAMLAGFYLLDATIQRWTAAQLEALLPAASPRARETGRIAAGMARILSGRGGPTQIRTALSMLTPERWTEAGDDPARWGWLTLGPLFLRESEQGRQVLRQVAERVRERSAVGMLPFLLFLLGRDESTTDRWADAVATYTEGARLARETGRPLELAGNLAGLAAVQARQGHFEQSRAHAEEALRISGPHRIHLFRVWATQARGDAAMAVDDMDAARACWAELAELLRTLRVRDPDLDPAPELVEVYLRQGDSAAAVPIAEAYWAAAQAKGQPWALARAHRCRALLAAPAAMAEHFEAALDEHARTPDLFEEARTRLAYGARLRRVRRRRAARIQLQRALSIFDHLGAQPWSSRCAAELRATGTTVRPHATRPADRLTPQQLQVALSLAAGRTTRETAAALFLSPKTVEYHLRHVYIELGIGSRAELATLLG